MRCFVGRVEPAEKGLQVVSHKPTVWTGTARLVEADALRAEHVAGISVIRWNGPREPLAHSSSIVITRYAFAKLGFAAM